MNGRMAVKVLTYCLLHLHLPDEDYHAGRLLPVLPPLFPPHLPLPLHLLLLLMTSMMTATTVKKKIMVTAMMMMMMMMMMMPMMVDLVPGAIFSPMLLHCGQERRSEFTSVEHYDISCT